MLMFRFRLNSWIYCSILFVQALLGFRADQWGQPVIVGYMRQEECFRGQNGHSPRKEAIGGSVLRPDRRTKPPFSPRGLGCKTAATLQPQNQTADPFPRSHKPFDGFILWPDRRLKPPIKCHVIILGIPTLTFVIPYKYNFLIIFVFYHLSIIFWNP